MLPVLKAKESIWYTHAYTHTENNTIYAYLWFTYSEETVMTVYKIMASILFGIELQMQN